MIFKSNKQFHLKKVKLFMLVYLSCLGCAHQHNKIVSKKYSSEFTIQEYCYINNKVLSYIMENNDLFFDSEYFTMLQFDKNSSSILCQKLNDSVLIKNLKYLVDTMEQPKIIQIKNNIEVLNSCNSTQMSVDFIDYTTLTNEHQLSTKSKYKCHFSISDIVKVDDFYYVFCEYSEYANNTNEVEKSILGFQFAICQNNGFIKFEYFLEWHGEMVGNQNLKLFTIKNDSIILNDIPKSDRFHQEAGFFKTKIKNFDCGSK